MKNRTSIIIYIAAIFTSVASTAFADEGTPLAPKFYKTYVQGNNEIIYNHAKKEVGKIYTEIK